MPYRSKIVTQTKWDIQVLRVGGLGVELTSLHKNMFS